MYLTTARNGDVVLDLWQSADNNLKKSKWANHAKNDANVAYPSNMYSTSYIRVSTLNNGGYYSNSGTQLFSVKMKQSESNQYAKFTMSSAEGSVVDYLVQPKDVAYQETEWDETTAGKLSTAKSYYPNDAYGKPKEGSTWTNNYEGKGDKSKPETMYDAWQYDYLWLPSVMEAGYGDLGPGIWKTDNSLRSPTTDSYTKSYAWLRSGDRINASNVLLLSSSGSANYLVSDNHLVRPTLHLNLTRAAGTLEKPTIEGETTLTYNGENHELTVSGYIKGKMQYEIKGDGANFDEATGKFTAKNAGTYTLTISLKDTTNTQWSEGGTENVTFTITISKAKVDVTWSEQSYIYTGEKLDNPTATVEGEGDDGTLDLTVTLTTPEQGEFKNVGSYTFMASLSEEYDKNYELTEETKTKAVTIAKATITAYTLIVSSHAYMGVGQDDVDVTLTDIQGEDNLVKGVDYTLTFTTENGSLIDGLPKDVGVYNVTVTLTESELAQNYEIASTAQAQRYEVKKAVLTFSVAGTTYNGEGQDVDVSFGGLQNGEELTKDVDYTVTVKETTVALEEGKPKYAGEYIVTVAPDPESDLAKNYEITTESQTFVISGLAVTICEFQLEPVFYVGQTTLSAVVEKFSIRDENGEFHDWSGDELKLTVRLELSEFNVGKRYAMIVAYDIIGEDVGNYNFLLVGNQAFIEVEVQAAPLTVSVNEDGSVSYYGFVGGEDESVLGGKLNLERVDNGDGTYTVTPSGLESENYNITYVSGVVSSNALGAENAELWIVLVSVGGAALVLGAAAIAVFAVTKKKKRSEMRLRKPFCPAENIINSFCGSNDCCG